jgi:hypothetical protein
VWTVPSVFKTLRADRTALDTSLGNTGLPRNLGAVTDSRSLSIHSITRHDGLSRSPFDHTVSHKDRITGLDAIALKP